MPKSILFPITKIAPNETALYYYGKNFCTFYKTRYNDIGFAYGSHSGNIRCVTDLFDYLYPKDSLAPLNQYELSINIFKKIYPAVLTSISTIKHTYVLAIREFNTKKPSYEEILRLFTNDKHAKSILFHLNKLNSIKLKRQRLLLNEMAENIRKSPEADHAPSSQALLKKIHERITIVENEISSIKCPTEALQLTQQVTYQAMLTQSNPFISLGSHYFNDLTPVETLDQSQTKNHFSYKIDNHSSTSSMNKILLEIQLNELSFSISIEVDFSETAIEYRWQLKKNSETYLLKEESGIKLAYEILKSKLNYHKKLNKISILLNFIEVAIEQIQTAELALIYKLNHNDFYEEDISKIEILLNIHQYFLDETVQLFHNAAELSRTKKNRNQNITFAKNFQDVRYILDEIELGFKIQYAPLYAIQKRKEWKQKFDSYFNYDQYAKSFDKCKQTIKANSAQSEGAPQEPQREHNHVWKHSFFDTAGLAKNENGGDSSMPETSLRGYMYFD